MRKIYLNVSCKARAVQKKISILPVGEVKECKEWGFEDDVDFDSRSLSGGIIEYRGVYLRFGK